MADLARDYLLVIAAERPESATALGIYTEDSRLDDRTLAGEKRRVAKMRDLKARAEKLLALAELRVADRTDLQLLVGAADADILSAEFIKPLERMPSVYTQPMNAMFLMSARDYASAQTRAEHMLARIAAIPGVVAAAHQNLKSPPKPWIKIGLDAAASAQKFFDEQRPFLIGAMPTRGKEIDVALGAAKKAYKEYAVLLKKLERSAKPDFAVGADVFSRLLSAQYGLTEPLAVTKARGKQVFERTRAEMETLARKIDPKAKEVAEVLYRLQGMHPKAGELLEAYRSETARARSFLVQKDAFEFPAGDDLAIVDTPVFMRGTIQAAYDQPPAFANVTKGYFFVTPVDPKWSAKEKESWLRENDHGDIVDTSVHEAYPGHHLQLSVARTHDSMFRKVHDAAIFSEGWALYSEELMNELGYYTPEERMLQLKWTLVRSARVLIDIGMHTENMTEAQAVDLLVKDVHLERKLAENEVRRYTESPTQPMAYLTGREQIFELRGKYQHNKGASYSLKAFHKEVLSHGTIPPSYIAAEMGLGGAK